MKDWREDYAICPHVEKKSTNIRHVGFRVCCEDCYKNGFMEKDSDDFFERKDVGKLHVMTL